VVPLNGYFIAKGMNKKRAAALTATLGETILPAQLRC